MRIWSFRYLCKERPFNHHHCYKQHLFSLEINFSSFSLFRISILTRTSDKFLFEDLSLGRRKVPLHERNVRRFEHWSSEHKSLITVEIFELLFSFRKWTSFILYPFTLTSLSRRTFFLGKSKCFSACFSQSHESIMIKSLHVNEQWSLFQLNLNLLFHLSKSGRLFKLLSIHIETRLVVVSRPNFTFLMRSDLVSLVIYSFYWSFFYPENKKWMEKNMKWKMTRRVVTTATIIIGEWGKGT